MLHIHKIVLPMVAYHFVHRVGEVDILRGAIIFLLVFIIFLIVTLGYQGLPPGRIIYDAVGGAKTDYPILGIHATELAIEVGQNPLVMVM